MVRPSPRPSALTSCSHHIPLLFRSPGARGVPFGDRSLVFKQSSAPCFSSMNCTHDFNFSPSHLNTPQVLLPPLIIVFRVADITGRIPASITIRAYVHYTELCSIIHAFTIACCIINWAGSGSCTLVAAVSSASSCCRVCRSMPISLWR